MITPEQIPDEVVEELHSLFAWIGNSDGAREALAAALAAWPGVETLMGDEAFPPGYFLPLPKEGE
jgi:pimeloyl-ACP methyl ester carboxylesterase